ncbi:MAG TPA: hypothetical protein VEQ65_08955, partial [Opitutus sp.]|nr:hypothetical protein [Opitutus sp.]
AVLFERLTDDWTFGFGSTFVWTALASEAALLLIAAQAGFLDGPRVLASMAIDRWFPTRFANLSDRLVTQNGILLMGGAALAMLLITRGSVGLLVVLYSINVFITFSLSQLGMVRHGWQVRRSQRAWRRKLAVNGFGLVLTTFILVSLTWVKFSEGGWVTLLVTGTLVLIAFGVHRHYRHVAARLRHLDAIVPAEAALEGPLTARAEPPALVNHAHTAILLVNGYNGLGLHTALHVPRMFGDTFRNLVFVQVGVVDAGNFKGADDLAALRASTEQSAARYVAWAQARGYGSTAFTAIGQDTVGEIMRLAEHAATRFPHHVFFAGQLLLARESAFTRLLHNATALTLQRRFLLANRPFVILPIRVTN